MTKQVRDYDETLSAFEVLRDEFFPGVENPEKIYAAVEEYRKEIGADKLHVSLGPKATPETVIAELKKIHSTMSEYHAIPESFTDHYKIKCLKERLSKIGKLSRAGYGDAIFNEPDPKEMKEALRTIWGLCDMIPEVDDPRKCIDEYKKSLGE